MVWLAPDRLVELPAVADRAGSPADADFRVDRLPANTHLCIDAVGGQHFIFKTDAERIGLHFDGALATLGPVRLTFSTVSLSGVSKAIDEYALLTEIDLSEVEVSEASYVCMAEYLSRAIAAGLFARQSPPRPAHPTPPKG